jgi:hypothetical protein
MATYEIGDAVRIKTWTWQVAGFLNVNGALADPTVVTLKVRDPVGAETTYVYSASAIVRDSVGKYHFDLGPLVLAGIWHYRWIGAGAVVAAAENRFAVKPSAFTNP